VGCAVWAGDYEKDEESKAFFLVAIPMQGMMCGGESCCSCSTVTIRPSCSTGRKMWSSYRHVMSEDPRPLSFGFLQVRVLPACSFREVDVSNDKLAHWESWVRISFTELTEHVNTNLHNKFLICGCLGASDQGSAESEWLISPARATFGTGAARVSRGVLPLPWFLVSLQEKSVTPTKATVFWEFKCHKGFSRIKPL